MASNRAFSPRRHRALSYGTAAAVLAVSCTVPSAVAAISDPDPMRLSAPKPTGPYGVGQVELALTDTSRGHPWVQSADQRDLMATLWYPAAGGGGEPARYTSDAVEGVLDGELEQLGLSRDAVDFAGTRGNATVGADVASGAGRLPVLLYSHGFNQSRHQATAQLEELASRGYAVVAMDHPYETSAVAFPDGRVVRDTIPGGDSAKAIEEGVAVRVADTRFVLDTLEAAADGAEVGGRRLPRGLGAALDLSAVGMFGHSAGGLTAAEAMLADERIDAGANLDGSIGYHVGDGKWAASTERGADRPFLIMGGGRTSGKRHMPHTSEHSPDWRMFRAASTGASLEVYFEEGEHMGFIDTQWVMPQIEARLRPGGPAWERGVDASIGTVDPERSVAAQRAYITAFFDAYVRGEPRPLLDGPSPEHPDAAFIE
ncbi:platelet-activating factor acetylhydrolase isoform II [Murinocardiopsis flavida]|uniref:Platelet-activating factor acetylhydrolase isoform II n=1 Tax=Murinocardiopsis flavida TaxID=645275 RepID=A0A2P8DDT6_9ACTN|nr:alpha/beta hydrolase [Murinocardiopsis flavida]PSK95386.1 platelet-activating factor acetylhydrolase isoform II [Murinocardiopsis flavida]